jgi:hypothetical protein
MAQTQMEIEEILNMGAYRKNSRMLALRRLLAVVL